MQEARYKAFISYSHKDDKWARWLHRTIEAYKPPRHLVGQLTRHGQIPARLAPVFRDRDELPSATDLGTAINEALQNSACQLVICSPAAAASKWVNEEILAFKRLGHEDRIFALIVAGEPNASDIPGRAGEECFPAALRFMLDADGALGTRRSEPIAADARDNKDGKTNAKMKLIAGMLGVGFDALKQRELARRNRRLMLVATASVAGMVLATGLAVLAMLARQEAVEQRTRAEAETETSRQVTTFLVDLFKVSDPSEALGNTITAREILDRGARRIEYELETQPAIQATLMDTMGTVYKSLGLYDSAKGLIERGLETRRRLFGDRNPEVARSQLNIGQLLGLRSELDTAAGTYEEAIRTLREASETSPLTLAQGLFGYAEIQSLKGNHAAAEKLLREAADLQRLGTSPGSLELAQSLERLGMTLVNQARYKEAEPLLREAVAMVRGLVPGGVHPILDDTLNDLAYFLYETGKFPEAAQLFRESLDINLLLLGDKHPDIAISMNNLAFVLQDSGDLAAAEKYYRQALDIRLASLGESHPLTAQSLNNLAFLYHDQGNLERGLEFSRKALAAYRRAYPGDHADVAYGLQNLAGMLVEKKDYEAAEAMLGEALAMNQRILPADHPDIAITQSGMAVLLLETGRAAQALEMATTASLPLAKALGSEHWRTAWARALEGASLTKLKRYAEAEPLLTQSYKVLSSGSGARPAQVDSALQYLTELYSAWGRPAEVARYRKLRVTAPKA